MQVFTDHLVVSLKDLCDGIMASKETDIPWARDVMSLATNEHIPASYKHDLSGSGTCLGEMKRMTKILHDGEGFGGDVGGRYTGQRFHPIRSL